MIPSRGVPDAHFFLNASETVFRTLCVNMCNARLEQGACPRVVVRTAVGRCRFALPVCLPQRAHVHHARVSTPAAASVNWRVRHGATFARRPRRMIVRPPHGRAIPSASAGASPRPGSWRFRRSRKRVEGSGAKRNGARRYGQSTKTACTRGGGLPRGSPPCGWLPAGSWPSVGRASTASLRRRLRRSLGASFASGDCRISWSWGGTISLASRLRRNTTSRVCPPGKPRPACTPPGILPNSPTDRNTRPAARRSTTADPSPSTTTGNSPSSTTRATGLCGSLSSSAC
jgi:hypothetical protein